MIELIDVAASLGRHPEHEVGDGSPASLLARMREVGIAGAVVAHTLATHHSPILGNRELQQVIADTPELEPAWTAPPPWPGPTHARASTVREALDASAAALVARPVTHGYRLAGVDATDLLTSAAAARLPVLIELAETDWQEVETVARRFPDLPLIVTEIGYRELRTLTGVLERNPQVHVTTANLSGHCAIEFVVERFGAHRILFGTGQPARDPGEAVLRVWWADVDDETAAMIGSGTLRRLTAATVPDAETDGLTS